MNDDGVTRAEGASRMLKAIEAREYRQVGARRMAAIIFGKSRAAGRTPP